jgi:outer membrane protein TolC
LAGCSARHYRKSADKEVAAIIADKGRYVTNMDPKFTIEAPAKVSLDYLLCNTNSDESFGPDKDLEVGARILSLEEALNLAVKYNRTYQNHKELLYLTALSLTLERHRYTPIFSTGAKTRYYSSRVDIEDGVNQVVEERSVSVQGDAGLEVLLRTGGRIATSFSTDFLRFLTGDLRAATGSQLVGTLKQPLLRGAGYQIAIERLTQAERDLLYELRLFTRYRKEFAVEIAALYYGVLEYRDKVRNNWRGFQSFRLNGVRERAFADEGLRPMASLDQIRQAELTTEAKWINAVRSYRQALDQFKIQLGLPTEAPVILDDRELEQLKILHPKIEVEDAVRVALASRLDLESQRDQSEDAERHVVVAANGLKPQLDLVGGVNVNAQQGNRFLPDFEHYSWNAGLDVELPLDRKAERYSYRSALIAQARAKRELTLAIDTIRLQITDGWRSLDQAKRNYEISEVGVALAARRVEEQDLRAQLGRGTARDLVDAQNDLINSKNERTAALVSHTIARLRFWRDMGILMIKENGQWEEAGDAVKN